MSSSPPWCRMTSKPPHPYKSATRTESSYYWDTQKVPMSLTPAYMRIVTAEIDNTFNAILLEAFGCGQPLWMLNGIALNMLITTTGLYTLLVGYTMRKFIHTLLTNEIWQSHAQKFSCTMATKGFIRPHWPFCGSSSCLPSRSIGGSAVLHSSLIMTLRSILLVQLAVVSTTPGSMSWITSFQFHAFGSPMRCWYVRVTVNYIIYFTNVDGDN